MTSAAPLILPFEGKTPRIHETAWIAPGAVIIGDVEIGPDSSVWYGCVLRADVGGRIVIGARSNLQDGTVVHVEHDVDTIIGDDVTAGHQALLHGTTIANGSLIGMKAACLSRSVIGTGALVAAGAVVLEGASIPDRVLAAGVPAKVRRELTPEESQAFIPHAAGYVALAKRQSPASAAVTLGEARGGEETPTRQ
ncbi:gamma carbonic anhydrase family protein [Pseudoclavibacter sp. RFBI5]|uniref:gamma carbonic anhydrase family protein n=1 Tax=Pseudoclavibacter sp. RFBI5 TaxID=2080578 RepID=UPI000CE77FB3|nr:gamma carbonic anhydrase family protein [Pseudoclavibacter sp. RFBI5]PPG04208.1 gamma carbonic anhydrase family protein [Pseudoclavibacter sp. RFBI5]